MKLIEEHQTSKWDDELVNDLSFIRKHRRYPLRRMTLMPLVSSVLLLAVTIWTFWDVLYSDKHSANNFRYVIVFLVAVPILASIGRYFNLIRFRAIHTPFPIGGNMKLLEQFLEEQKLITFRHPTIPEVYQIISKNISAIGDDREVLIFLADDKRILINSHYTSSRKWFRFMSPPTHEHEMIKMFMKWLSSRPSSSSTSPVQQGFS